MLYFAWKGLQKKKKIGKFFFFAVTRRSDCRLSTDTGELRLLCQPSGVLCLILKSYQILVQEEEEA